MLEIANIRDEMLGMYEVLEDDRVLKWAESLKDTKNLFLAIQSIREGLLEDIESKDSFTQNIFQKWMKNVEDLLERPGYWFSGMYKSWDDLCDSGKIYCDGSSLYDASQNLYGKLVISDTITNIKKRAFMRCNFKEIILPETIKYIGFAAFYGCEKLEFLRIPESALLVDGQVISRCSNLSILEIPERFRPYNSSSHPFYEGDLKVQIKYY